MNRVLIRKHHAGGYSDYQSFRAFHTVAEVANLLINVIKQRTDEIF